MRRYCAIISGTDRENCKIHARNLPEIPLQLRRRDKTAIVVFRSNFRETNKSFCVVFFPRIIYKISNIYL